MEIKVLDKGFVRLVDVMGSDADIVAAARVSYGKGTKTLRDDRGLIRYLMRNEHMSPFEMCELKYHIKMPIFVARQHLRHRTASVNEISARYSIIEEEFYLPECARIKKQSSTNKQGSGEAINLEDAKRIVKDIECVLNEAYNVYTDLIEFGVAREIARIVLPTSFYTQFYWKIDLRNFFNYLKLRLDSHAQEEIRLYAKAMYDLAKPYFPFTFEAFEDYVLSARKFSRKEFEIILKHLNLESIFSEIEASEDLSNTEKIEFKNKLAKDV